MSIYAGAVFMAEGFMLAARDYENGSLEVGSITGTIKFRVSAQVSVPIRCRVVVLRDFDHQPVRETMSDATTGAWSVSGIDKHLAYSAIAYHPTTAARAVIADGVYPV
jgi:hypothetical protein